MRRWIAPGRRGRQSPTSLAAHPCTNSSSPWPTAFTLPKFRSDQRETPSSRSGSRQRGTSSVARRRGTWCSKPTSGANWHCCVRKPLGARYSETVIASTGHASSASRARSRASPSTSSIPSTTYAKPSSPIS